MRMSRGPRLRSSVSIGSENFAKTLPAPHPGRSYLLELEVSPVRNSTTSPSAIT
jgi:hypothetical protein